MPEPVPDGSTEDLLPEGALRAAFGDGGGFAPPAGDPDDDPGLVSGRYRIAREIGAGGQGTVYLAEDLRLGRPVAIKMLTGFGRLPAEMLRRFEREARLASKLSHPGICAVHDFGVHEGVPYIAMRHVPGDTLAQRVRAAAGLSTHSLATTPDAGGRASAGARAREPATAVDDVLGVLGLVEKAARALHAAHEAGVIHRDVKPGNVMVTPEGEPVILDFGLAREADHDGPTLTRAGDLFGTPAYMSPEQLAAEPVVLDRRTDVWSLGVTLFECLTHRRPFEAPTREGLYAAIRTQDPPDARKLNPALGPDVKVILDAALEKDRERRYQTAADLAEDLRRVRAREPILARPVGRWTRFARWAQRNPALAATGAVALLILAAGAIVAAALAVEARSALQAYDRLADARVLDDLLAEQDRLWPAVPARLPALDAWLAEARRLAERLPRHEADLAALRKRARPWSAEAAARDRASHVGLLDRLDGFQLERDAAAAALETLESSGLPEARKETRREALAEKLADAEGRLAEERRRAEPVLSGRLTWEFDDPLLGWRHEKLAALVAGLGVFASAGPKETGIRGVEARREFAATLWRRTVEDHAHAWIAARQRVAADARFQGVAFREQAGLIPLGPDPASGLEEFGDIATGEPPVRDPASGRFGMEERTALVFVLVPGGTYFMGAQGKDPDGPNFDRNWREDEAPPVSVTLTPFLISKFEMTQAQWLRATGSNSSEYRPVRRIGRHDMDLRHPVEQVSWTAAERELRRLGFVLPTEAQWEFACRAGTTTPFSFEGPREAFVGFGNCSDDAFRRTEGAPWVQFETWDDGHAVHAPVGSFRPNAFGLHDMHGNVLELCRDRYGRLGDFLPRAGPPGAGDGLRPVPGSEHRTARGGSFQHLALNARSALRARLSVSQTASSVGVRPARALDP